MGCRRAEQVFNRRWWFSRSSLSDSAQTPWTSSSSSAWPTSGSNSGLLHCSVFSTHPQDSRDAPQDVPRPERAGSFDPAAPPQPRFTPRFAMADVSERTLQLSVLVAFASGVLVGWQANRLRRLYPGLEEEEAARQASGDAEEAGSWPEIPALLVPADSRATTSGASSLSRAGPRPQLGPSHALRAQCQACLGVGEQYLQQRFKGGFGNRPISCGKGFQGPQKGRESSVFPW